MRKRYGDTNTGLDLSEKARRCYSDTDPLSIYEEDNGTYTMTGVIEQSGLTATEVNEWLEDLADEMAATDEEDGEVLCGRCGAELECDECGDMPERCPECGTKLDYSYYEEG